MTNSKNTLQRIKGIIVLFIILILTPLTAVWADDIEAVLDSADGSSVFAVQDSAPAEVFHIDSDGNVVAEGCVRIDSSGTECVDTEGLIVDGTIGIGVTTATTALHIDSNAVNTTAVVTIENSGGDMQVLFTQVIR